jgi:hypothetical protein
MREQQTGEDKRAGQPANNHVHFHTLIPSRQQRKSYKPIAFISILWGVHPIVRRIQKRQFPYWLTVKITIKPKTDVQLVRMPTKQPRSNHAVATRLRELLTEKTKPC